MSPWPYKTQWPYKTLTGPMATSEIMIHYALSRLRPSLKNCMFAVLLPIIFEVGRYM